jgi:hypothetical protein
VQFFADENDVPLLLTRLNDEPELAFIVRDVPFPLGTRLSSEPVGASREDTCRAQAGVNWVGNRYALIGAPAHPATARWWARFRRWMRTHATPLTVHRQVTFFAFPSALDRLRSGIAYDANNWDLGPVLKSVAR